MELPNKYAPIACYLTEIIELPVKLADDVLQSFLVVAVTPQRRETNNGRESCSFVPPLKQFVGLAMDNWGTFSLDF